MGDGSHGSERRLQNWFHDVIQHDDGVIATPTTEDAVIAILADAARYPSPVRPVGSRHSMTPCISARAAGGNPERWGTLVDMTGLTTLRDGDGRAGAQPLKVVPDPDGRSGKVTVPAGRTFISVARELNEKGWVFHVNTELGPLTMGAAACGATKDSSFPGEYGQVCHDAIGMRLIRPDGTPQDLKEGDRDFDALRCSYGLFGIVTEVTCRVFPLEHEYISLRHEEIEPDGDKFTPAELKQHFDTWLGKDGAGTGEHAVFLYLFPYRNRIVAELRQKPATGNSKPEEKSVRLSIRNKFWGKRAHDVETLARRMRQPAVTHAVQDLFGGGLREYFEHVLRLERLNPVAQIVDFDENDEKHRFTFSMWAFPEHEFHEILPRYFELCKSHESTFRTGLPHASYHIAQDTSSLLSYSRRGPVWTLDPICPQEPDGTEVAGWKPFLEEFNAYCSAKGGVPLLNQTPYLTRDHVKLAFGERLREFEAARKRFDPGGRMLNAYFADFLAS